ncbi:hypothetical protein [Streptomyces omiyaensis]|uniref:hypothetical protein n=1 Tax=Streptomyces omiyaensis TaxID=68247 RepID=UPI0036FA35B3
MALVEAINAPVQGTCWVAGVIMSALAEGLVEENGRVVAGCFCVGEDGGEGVPGGVLEDAVGDFGYGPLDVAGVAGVSLLGLDTGARRARPSRMGTATWA